MAAAHDGARAVSVERTIVFPDEDRAPRELPAVLGLEAELRFQQAPLGRDDLEALPTAPRGKTAEVLKPAGNDLARKE